MSSQGSSGESFSSETLGSLLSMQEGGMSQMGGMGGGQGIFESLDTDADGALSTDELTTALSNALGESDDISSAVNSLISDGDTDGDGVLTGGEFAALAQASGGPGGMGGPPPGPPPSGGGEGGGAGGAGGGGGVSQVFDSLDTNQDGTVSAAELAAADTDSADAATAAADLISAADTDGDGSLSGQEFGDLLKQASDSSSATTLAGALSSSSLASDMMQKLLQQLADAATSSAASGEGVSSTSSVSIAA